MCSVTSLFILKSVKSNGIIICLKLNLSCKLVNIIKSFKRYRKKVDYTFKKTAAKKKYLITVQSTHWFYPILFRLRLYQSIIQEELKKKFIQIKLESWDIRQVVEEMIGQELSWHIITLEILRRKWQANRNWVTKQHVEQTLTLAFQYDFVFC